jgi:hypothetical protein
MGHNPIILALKIPLHGPWTLRKRCRWVYRIKNYTCCFARSLPLNHPLILEIGMPWQCWLRHSSTSRKDVSSIPDGIIGIFHWHNPSSCTMALRSTQPLTEMSTRNISWRGKGSPCTGLTTLPPSMCQFSWNLGNSTSSNPKGLAGPVMELLYITNPWVWYGIKN